MNLRGLGAIAGLVAAIGACSLPAADEREEPRSLPTPAAQRRDAALLHARVRLGPLNRSALTAEPSDTPAALTSEMVSCHFVPRVPGGTSFKFDCALDTGDIVRVKYGHEPEIHAEVAAARLLTALGYAADRMSLVPRLRCYGCPAHPFVAMKALDLVGAAGLLAHRDGYVDFEWVAVERRFPAAPIEDEARKGWAWWELKQVNAPRDELDAFRLVAAFLAHWDNKADNQRLVCMDAVIDEHGACADPLLMIQDLGSTFGPAKVNLSQWRQVPVWSDRSTCTVSMQAMPYRGATFVDARITDTARLRVGGELASFSDAELEAWFAAARFPEFYAATDDRKDLTAWVDAYRSRVSQILTAGPCTRPDS